MRIVPFPGHDDASAEETWLAELDAALSGAGEGPAADSWRELREDVRALAPPMTADFERQLAQRIAERCSHRRAFKGRRALKGRGTPGAPGTLRERLHRPGRPLGAAVAAAISAAVVAVVIAGPWQSGPSREAAPSPAVRSGPSVGSGGGPGASFGVGAANPTSRKAQAAVAGSATPTTGGPTVAEPATPATGGPASAPGRVQQLGATVTLTATPSEVQTTADRVARLAVSDGGFVQSSRVQVQQAGTSEANLTLRLPSERLSAAIASLERLAPVHAESQSLQDITDAYDAARRRLADATAERQALLRALAQASTQGQIDSLRERLSQARTAIAQARSALAGVSRRASTAEVEVTVLGDTHAGSEGLTLQRGLEDAGRVLTVTLSVLLLAAAGLVPSALVLAALVTGRRAWLRHRREHALD